jgi:CRP-like cAMP-binding protein
MLLIAFATGLKSGVCRSQDAAGSLLSAVCRDGFWQGRKQMTTQNQDSVLFHLSDEELRQIKADAKRRSYRQGELIFAEDDPVDFIYFVESGAVSVQTERFASRCEVAGFGPGEYFGEMALFQGNHRNASAVARCATDLSLVSRERFLELLASQPQIAAKVNQVLERRSQERLLKENLVRDMGVDGQSLHVGIKGDPSLRESAFSRQRYQSMVDKVLPQLMPQLEALILDRCVYQWTLHFNSGEVRTSTVFNPFHETAHAAEKLLNPFYFERNFPALDYQRKTDLIRRMFAFLRQDPTYAELPAAVRGAYQGLQSDWQPAPPAEVRNVIGKLDMLRGIESFYVRNLSLSMVTDLIRIQFNCDGTHILSSDYYERFIEENIA